MSQCLFTVKEKAATLSDAAFIFKLELINDFLFEQVCCRS